MAKRVLHDEYFKKAKTEGYLARSAYKLIEIDEKYRVLRKGNLVLDLGAAPGSWTQVASDRVGITGRIVALDILNIRVSLGNAATFLADVNEVTPEILLGHTGGERFDVIISDMAPNTSGHGDHFRSVRLCERALELATDVLRPGGNLVMKVFEGETYPDLLKETARRFANCKGFKPKSTRDISKEMFIVAMGFRDAAPDKKGATV
jgi:23S rRNA (uridine2552-2'-O)-methyltransferase